mmetsp:Transcript_63160/g.195562  ORF Transcript_63160/g.195562 Transcript_63160/m.195562 type:complete len:334 (+) Transcript_63160:56-1057(+)|eukprot:CAMPEP_0204581408 /NCGR_PEP_ID=MMETSP0661-20131031/44625_1 /ASSEMBLY_ACC=CAM_ASM_000606 /TAXON_ID=109239 /ORGANISM="Alexandrium margalefi, Strain AMGDE01CS-322" /LENGTH=333 /DNA_ID=CAMNT_0051590595 /DNA_START=56 /DNA_END=1057 /DNA_ORIENTATION=+
MDHWVCEAGLPSYEGADADGVDGWPGHNVSDDRSLEEVKAFCEAHPTCNGFSRRSCDGAWWPKTGFHPGKVSFWHDESWGSFYYNRRRIPAAEWDAHAGLPSSQGEVVHVDGWPGHNIADARSLDTIRVLCEAHPTCVGFSHRQSDGAWWPFKVGTGFHPDKSGWHDHSGWSFNWKAHGWATDRQFLLLSGRFDGDANESFMRRVADKLQFAGVSPYIVKANAGDQFGMMTKKGLRYSYAMVAFASQSPPYGQDTGNPYSTYHELEYYIANKAEMRLLIVQLADTFPPTTGEEAGDAQNSFAFKSDLVRIDGRNKSPEALADDIAKAALPLRK